MHDQMYPNLPQPVHVDIDHHRRWKPKVEMAPSCPRCDSSNTKFCYYNNYSLTQPRYFCKACRRYWTKGGSLRNVPVGGACRRTRRAKSSSSRPPSTCSPAVVKRPSTHHNGAPLRPDLALDDMVGAASHQSIGILLDDASSSSTATDGSSIDLAVLYSKFLSQSGQQQPEGGDQGLVDVCGGGGDAGDLVGSSSTLDQVVGLIGDFDYSFDTPDGSYELLGLPEVQHGEVFFSVNPSTSHVLEWQAPPEHLQQAGFCSVPDVVGMNHHRHHHQDLMGGEWFSPSIDQSSFGGAL